MKYVKAIDVLPQEIIEIIQNYVDGEYLYIPRKNDNKIIYLSDYNDEITTNSFNMLNEFNDLLK